MDPNKNLEAFYETISFSEGTWGKNGIIYNALFGGGTFTSYADHPRIRIFIPRLNEYTTAAGGFQMLANIYDYYKQKLNLLDFSPAAQRAICEQLISERNALELVKQGNFDAAVLRCSKCWASFPGAGYKGQRENKLSDLRNFYVSRGGGLIEASTVTTTAAAPTLPGLGA